MPPKSELHCTDIALLHVIKEHPNSRKNDLWQPFGKGAWNQYLRQSGLIQRGHCTLVKGFFRFTDSIATLHLCGYLRTDTPHYQASDHGINLFYTLDKHPCRWPLLVPLDEAGKRLWDEATYFDKQ